MSESLRILQTEAPDCLQSIVDIGVQYGTRFLIEACPHSRHLLFEPAQIYREAIENAYAQIDHEYFQAAVAAEDAEMFVNNFCNMEDQPERITHSYVASTPVSDARKNFHSAEPIRCFSLDTLLETHLADAPDLSVGIKVDVDGLEEQIIGAWSRHYGKVSTVVVECPLQRVTARAQLLEERGFRLFDICDPGYYFGKLTQVELVYVNESMYEHFPALDPWTFHQGALHAAEWQHNQ